MVVRPWRSRIRPRYSNRSRSRGEPLLHVTGHNERTPLAPEGPSVTRAVAQFALTGLIVLALFLVGSLLVFRSFGRDEALRDARQFAVLSGQGIVEPAIRAGVLTGAGRDGRARPVVNERVLGERVVRVKIWDLTGRVVYSDEPRLIGSQKPARRGEAGRRADGRDARRAERPGRARRTASSRPGRPVRGVPADPRADGTPLLFETYQPRAKWRPPDAGSGCRSRGSCSPASCCCGSSRYHSPGGSRTACGGASANGRRSSSGRSRRRPTSGGDRRRPPRRRRAGSRRDLVLVERRRRAAEPRVPSALRER